MCSLGSIAKCFEHPAQGAFVYLIGFDANLDGFEQANCQQRLQSTAREHADCFVTFCEARRLFFDERTHTSFDPNLFQEHRSKRIDLYKTFHIFCNGILLNRLASEQDFDDVFIYGATTQQFAYLDSTIERKCHQSSVRKSASPFNFVPGLLRFTLSIIGLLLIAMPFRLVAKWKRVRVTHQTGGKWFFSIWPITFLDDRSTDRIYGPLDDGALQIVSLFADGIHQPASMMRYLQFQQLRAKNGSVVLEDHLCWSDLWCLLTGVFKAFVGFGLKGSDCNSAFDMLFHEEDLVSRFRAPRLLLFYRLFCRFVRRQKPQELHYHLFEYPLGKIISFVAESYDCWRVGYQHGPAAEMKLLCRDGSGDSDYIQMSFWLRMRPLARSMRKGGQQKYQSVIRCHACVTWRACLASMFQIQCCLRSHSTTTNP